MIVKYSKPGNAVTIYKSYGKIPVLNIYMLIFYEFENA